MVGLVPGNKLLPVFPSNLPCARVLFISLLLRFVLAVPGAETRPWLQPRVCPLEQHWAGALG